MPEETDDTQDEDLVPRSHIRDLEAKAKRADELERRLAFAEALGPTSDPRLDYFKRAYSGDLTADAIKAEAQRAGFLTTSTEQEPPQQQAPPPPDLDAHGRVAAASAGASQNTAIPLEEAIAAAQSPEEVMAIMTAAGFPTIHNRE